MGDTRLGLVILLLVLAGLTAPGAAQTVDMEVSSREVYVNVPFELTFILRDVQNYDRPQLPSVDGLQFGQPRIFRTSGATITFNGRRVGGSSEERLSYLVTAARAGVFEIPPLTVVANGVEYTSNPIVITAQEPDGGDVLIAEIASGVEQAFVGQFVDLELRLWIKVFEDPKLGVKLSSETMWRLLGNDSQWGDFAESLRELITRRGRSLPSRLEQRLDADGVMADYYVYEIETSIRLAQAGALPLRPVLVSMKYPERLVRDRWGDLQMPASRRVIAAATPPTLAVSPPPLEGRPAGFTGAIGRYSVHATAEPPGVVVGDPITITLTIIDRTGAARMDLLRPPILDEIEALTTDFRVPVEALAGTVSGRRKVFTQTIRARRDDVTEIPAIPFVFFDPAAGAYQTVATLPIPIDVTPATTLAMTDVVGAVAPVEGVSELTEVAGGILANQLGADVLAVTTPASLGWGHALIVLVPPLAFTVMAIGQRRSRRLREDHGYARRRRAKRTALRRLADVQADNGTMATGVAAALSDYVADRCNLPAGALTAAEVVSRLRDGAVADPLVDAVASVLAECEAQRYAGGSAATSDVLERATRCIDDLERERLG